MHDKDVSVLIYKPLKRIDSASFQWPVKLDGLLIRRFHQELVCSYFSVSFQLRTQTVLRCSQLEVKTLCLKAILPVFYQLKAVLYLFSQLKGKRHPMFMACFFFPTIKQSSIEYMFILTGTADHSNS